MWNFPNCGGALDGRHVAIVKPANEGSYYFNYKGYHSVVLLGLVDANLTFIMADVGCNGRVSDGGGIEETTFYRTLKNGALALPKNDDTVGNMNFVFVADEAFALRENILKPFPCKDLTHEKQIFNYRLSRARRCAENAFGVLAARFRIFHTTINMQPLKVNDIVMACVVLHNFLRRNHGTQYTPGSMLDREDLEDTDVVEGDWRNEQPEGHFDMICSVRQVTPATEVSASRDKYVEYFNGPGKVPFQNRMVGNRLVR
ncbi:uncharacterized protein LOC111866708 [Cryptotermes secundus]|nr:uncharacterized protein LOC111866708 [Cryptotermes secundus]